MQSSKAAMPSLSSNTRSSARSVTLEHLNSLAASRDAHIAATHAFRRAKERASNSSDNMFPVLPRPPDPEKTPTPALKSRHSVRFVGSSGAVKSKQRLCRTSSTASVNLDTSTITNTSPLKFQLDDKARLLPTAEITDPPANTRPLETLRATKCYREGIHPNNSAHSLVTSTTDPSSFGSYIRRSKSLLNQSKEGLSEQIRVISAGSGNESVAKLVTENFTGGLRTIGRQSLRALQSTAVLMEEDTSHDSQLRDLAVKLARDKWNNTDCGNKALDKQKSHHLASLFSRSNSTKGVRKSMRANDAHQHVLSFSFPHNTSLREASFRFKARKASHSLRNKLRGIFKLHNIDPENGEDDHANSCHDSESGTGISSVNGGVFRIQHDNTGSVSRVPSGMASLVDVPDHQAMRSRQGSIGEFVTTQHTLTEDDKSRVTSWTSSGVTASSTQSGNTWPEWERQGSQASSPPLPSPGLIVDSQRVYSALMKRLDETRRLGRIEEKNVNDGSPLTIRPISANKDDSDALNSSLELRRALSKPDYSPSSNSCSQESHSDEGIDSPHPITHLENVPQPPRIIANRQSAFFGSPTCHLFRTKSPYRRALQKSMKEEEEALSLHEENLTAQDKPSSKPILDIPPRYSKQDFPDSPSVYSCDSPVRPPTPSKVAVEEICDRKHGEATIFLNAPTYCPPLRDNGRIISNASSVEWKSWLSSHVSRLEPESPTRTSPYAVDNIYSPVTMSPSFYQPLNNIKESTQNGSGDSNISYISSSKQAQCGIMQTGRPEPLRPTSGNISALINSNPRRTVPESPIGMTGCSVRLDDENVPPDAQQHETARFSPPPPIPTRNPLRNKSSLGSVKALQPNTRAPIRAMPAVERVDSPTIPLGDRVLQTMRSSSSLNSKALGQKESKPQTQYTYQPAWGCLTGLSCASTPGFPVGLEKKIGGVWDENGKQEISRPPSEGNSDDTDTTNMSSGMALFRNMEYLQNDSREVIKAFLNERRRRMVSSGKDAAFI